MTLDAAIVIAALSLICSGIMLFTTLRRNNKKDDSNQAAGMTTVIVKLENIGEDVKDIKGDLKDIKHDIQQHSERLAVMEQKVRSLNYAVFGNHEGRSPREDRPTP